jgi:hypothetical protein
MGKARLTVTVDHDLIMAGQQAVAAGQAESLSNWVSIALMERAAKERRLRALADAVAAYEAEHGPFTTGEMAAQEIADREAAVVIRGRRKLRPNPE